MSNVFGNFIFWTALSFIVLLVFSCIAFTAHKGKRRNYKYMAIMFMLGIYLSNVTFISPLIFFGNAVEWKEQVSSYNDVTIKNFSKNTKLPEKTSVFSHFNNEFKITDSKLLLRDSILYGLIYSTKMSGLGVKYQALIPTSFYFSIFSGTFFIILTILTPIAFGGLVASFFEGALAFVRYFITKNFCDIYYFSDLNEKSVLLAKDIHEKQKHCLIVFCNKNKKTDSALLQEAKYNGFILTTRNELDFAKKSKHAHHFFEMGKDESKNLSDVYALLKEYEKFSKNKNFKVYLFAESETSFEAFNRTDGKEHVIILNRFRTAFYNVLFKKPLYECLKNSGRTDFSITVIGAGKCGTEIIKACTWCTQLGTDYSTKINVIDKHATLLESQLKKECPELISDYYDIHFYDCDVTTDAFYNILKEKCPDANYITVATGYDDMNLKVAMDVRRFYLINSTEYDNEPTIKVYTENDRFKASNEKEFDDYKLEAFGSDEEFYSYSLIVNSEIEKLAKNSSCVYNYWKNKKDEKNKEESYYGAREIERDSNRTNAIHLVYKLYLFRFGIIEKKQAEQEQINASPELLKQLKDDILSDKTKVDNLAYIEHDRWNAFYRGEGWCGIPHKNWNTFYKKYNSQKNHLLKQHACICPYDKLEEAEKIFKLETEEKELRNNDFREYDYAYINYLTKTLGLEKDDSSEINISGVEYILVKLR